MHVVIWKYQVMEGKNRQDLLDAINGSVPDYENVPGLVRKYSGISPDCRSVAEIYLWTSKTIADKFFSPEWDGETSRRWESARMIREDYEVPVIVENEKNGETDRV